MAHGDNVMGGGEEGGGFDERWGGVMGGGIENTIP